MIKEMKTEIIEMTPTHAEYYLSNNKENRKLTKGRVNKLCSAMVRGEWKLSPQPIIISKSGRLLDGQHRLSALIMYGKPLKMSLTTNAEDDIFDIIDTGKNRSYADVTGLDRKQAQAITAIASYYYKTTPTHPQSHLIRDLYIEQVKKVTSVYNKGQRILTSASFASGLAYMIKRFDNEDYVLEIYENVIKQNYSQLNDVSSALLRIYNKSLLGQVSVSKSDVFTIACKFADQKNSRLSRILYSTDKYLHEFDAFTNKLLEANNE